MKKILVATDFSQASSNALRYATGLALALKADIVLFHVYEIPVRIGEIPITMEPQSIHEHAEREMSQLKEQLLDTTSEKVNVTLYLRSGSFYNELEIACESIKPYLVVMGSQGTTGAERLLFGSHAVRAMNHLQSPLITVPLQAEFKSIKQIAFAGDLSKTIDPQKTRTIAELTSSLGAALHVLNVHKKEEFDPEAVFQATHLDEIMKNIKPRMHFITDHDIDQGIIDFVEKNDIDLLIVLPRRRGILERLIQKSHSSRLVLHSHVPIMGLH